MPTQVSEANNKKKCYYFHSSDGVYLLARTSLSLRYYKQTADKQLQEQANSCKLGETEITGCCLYPTGNLHPRYVMNGST